MFCLRSDVLAGSEINHSQSDVVLLLMRLRNNAGNRQAGICFSVIINPVWVFFLTVFFLTSQKSPS